MKKVVTLTMEQAVELELILREAASTCKRQRENWERYAEETNPDGTPRLPYARGNAQILAESETRIAVLYELIDKAPYQKE